MKVCNTTTNNVIEAITTVNFPYLAESFVASSTSFLWNNMTLLIQNHPNYIIKPKILIVWILCAQLTKRGKGSQ